jgi:uncharacterized SAM-binding protein YcdF (DUF218 family)
VTAVHPLLPLLAGVAAVVAAATAWTTARRVRLDRGGDSPAPADAIVVFGAQAFSGRPSAELRARLEHAALLAREGWAPRIVCSGGPDEARAMRAALLRLGVREAAVEMDPQGVSTRATVRAARDLGRVLLVSSPWHVHRIRSEAARQGLSEARVCPAPRSPIERHGRARQRQLLREIAASWWYRLRSPLRARA